MADSIVQGLFGISPYEAEQQQNAGLFKAADQFAAQTPFQQATGQLYRAGGMLGGAAAEGMGMVNPRVQEAKEREAALAGIDLSSPESIAKRAMQVQNPRLRMELGILAQKQRAAQQEQALKRAQELAALHKAQAESSPYAKINPKDYTQESLRAYAISKNPADLEAINPEGKMSQWAIQLKDAGYEPGTPEFNAEMKKRWDAEVAGSRTKGTNITNVMPGTEKAIDVPKLRNEIRQSIKPEIEQIGFADTALTELELAIKTDNPIAYQTARTNLARAAGGGNISREEIKAAGGDPSLFGQIGNATSVWVTGTPMLDTQQKMRATVRAIRKVAAKKARNELDAQAALLHRSGYAAEDIDALLRMKDLDGVETKSDPVVAGSTVTLKSGKKVQRVD